MRYFFPTLLVLTMAGYALAEGAAAADHAPTSSVTPERIAAVMLALLLVAGLARVRRTH
jgi:hypothetical protein